MKRQFGNKQELIEFVAYIIVFGPNNFPDGMDMDIADAFTNIENGLRSLVGELGGCEKVEQLVKLVESAEFALKDGDEIKGLHLLQDLRSAL
jgi:hypothetical protein